MKLLLRWNIKALANLAVISALVIAALIGTSTSVLQAQVPPVQPVDEAVLREYAGVYRWKQDSFLYLQLWSEFAGTNQLVAFDETGEVRTLFATDRDWFFAGPGAAVPTAVESEIEFQRSGAGSITSLVWRRSGVERSAVRVDIENSEYVRFANGDVRLAGTLIRPTLGKKHPAIILVHGSGAADREYMLPFARFLIRRGIAVLGYDKRGVGGSTGDWRSASFDDLAGDVVAAFRYLKTRRHIDGSQIGLLGWSQAGWVMPLAAVREKDIAFLISVSGAAIPVAETTIDQARNEMTASGRQPHIIDQIIDLMKLQYTFAQTNEGWASYVAARDRLIAQIGRAPDSFPATSDAPQWETIRRLYLYEPAPTLRQLQTPILGIFGELDNNILAEKNMAAWESALKASGNRDYTLRIVPKANHLQLEANIGSNAEMPSLRRFAPAYANTIIEWLATRVRGFEGP
jgi:pimeloyl-ACP methyl ester carboxylesterase